MGLYERLNIGPGVTSVIGSGGKSSLLSALARELPGSVVLTTTTHIRPFSGIPLVTSGSADEVRAVLAASRAVCVGAPAEQGKLAAPAIALERLAALADYVLVEADGSRGLPLKAHAAWEPVVDACSQRTVLVVGARGIGRPVREAAHRPERFCALAGCGPDDLATPERIARVIAAEALADAVLISQLGDPDRIAPARALARALAPTDCHLWI